VSDQVHQPLVADDTPQQPGEHFVVNGRKILAELSQIF
jgi:hypothetical protein